MSARSGLVRVAQWLAMTRARLGIGTRHPTPGAFVPPKHLQSGERELEYGLEYLFSYYITVSAPEVIGPVPDGLRLNFYITGGEITGPKLTGTVRRVGADWVNIRRDGIALIDVRAVFETQEGALIDVIVNGTADLGEDGYARTLSGARPSSPTHFRIRLQFRTADARYAWLNRPYCIGIGDADFERFRVEYDVYAVR